MAENDKNRKGPSEEDLENQKDFLRTAKEIETAQRSYLGTLKDIEKARARVKQLESKINELREQNTQESNKAANALQETLDKKRETIEQHRAALQEVSKLRKFVTEPLGRSIDKLGDSIKQNVSNELRSLPQHLLDTTKEVKNAELRMGKLSMKSQAFTSNLANAAMETTKLGSSIGEMAQLQADYASQIGRSVSLTEEGQESMAALVHGTTLGKEGAVEMASQMELLGHNVSDTEKFMNDLLDSTHDLNLSTEKVTDNFKQATQLAQRFRFEEGPEDMQKMAEQASKFKMNMEATAPMAEKVFNVEGAVEMAANLQVLGGEMSKLADPFKLMHQARNDFQKFSENVAKSTSKMASFNEETGQFEFGGLQLHRIRQISEATGIATEELTKMGRQTAKLEEIEKQMPELSMKNITGGKEEREKVMEFIKNGAELTKGKEAQITFRNKLGVKDTKLVKNLTEENIKQIRNVQKQKATAKEIAEQAKTFDTAATNLINMVKATLAPAFKAFSDAVTGGLQNFQDEFKDNAKTLKNWMESFGKWTGKFISGVMRFIKDNPLNSILYGGAAAIIGKMAQWYARGRILGKGFLHQAKSMGMGGAGRGGTGAKWSKKQKSYKQYRKQGYGQKEAKRKAYGRFGGMRTKMGRMGGGALGMIGLGAGIGMDMLKSQLVKSGAIEKGGTAAKTMGVGSSALSGAAQGAMLGSMFGPVGTAIGAGIGGLGAGAMKYSMMSGGGGNETTARSTGVSEQFKRQDDFIVRPGEGVVPFNENDTVMGMKEGGPIEKSFSEDVSNTGGEVEVKFNDTLQIDGTITLKSEGGGRIEDLDLDNNPQLRRKLVETIQQEVDKNIDGGKLQPNP